MLLSIGLIVVSIWLVSGADPTAKCERNWKKIGCFRDKIIPKRTLPEQLVNYRDVTSEVYDGHILNWKKWPQSLHALACTCAELTKERGHLFFGLQFYGECWSESGDNSKYYMYGRTDDKCIGIDYKQCDDKAETECVGKTFTNYVYELKSGGKTDTGGGWGEWSEWSICDKSCDGGHRTRDRECNNPKPSREGRFCEGEGTEEEKCNTEKCQPVCKSKLEIGIITDASSSVTNRNYNKMKEFIIKLTEEFTVGADGVHFGMIHYSWFPHLDFTMNQTEYWNVAALREKIRSSEYIYGGTRTDLALYEADKKLFCTGCVRAGVGKILIVLTDGRTSMQSDSMTEATKSLKAKGVSIISMGIGNRIDKDELLEIATDEEHVFLIKDFEYLVDKLNDLLKLSCISG